MITEFQNVGVLCWTPCFIHIFWNFEEFGPVTITPVWKRKKLNIFYCLLLNFVCRYKTKFKCCGLHAFLFVYKGYLEINRTLPDCSTHYFYIITDAVLSQAITCAIAAAVYSKKKKISACGKVVAGVIIRLHYRIIYNHNLYQRMTQAVLYKSHFS